MFQPFAQSSRNSLSVFASTLALLLLTTTSSRAVEPDRLYRGMQTTQGLSIGIGGSGHQEGRGSFTSQVRVDLTRVAGEIIMHAGASMLRLRGSLDLIPVQVNLVATPYDSASSTRLNLEMVVTVQGAGDLISQSRPGRSQSNLPTYFYVGPEVAASLIHSSSGVSTQNSRGPVRGLFLAMARVSAGAVGGLEIQNTDPQALAGVTARIEGKVMMSLDCESSAHSQDCHAVYLRGSSRVTQNLLHPESGVLLQNRGALGYEYTMRAWGPGDEGCNPTGSCRFGIFAELNASQDVYVGATTMEPAASNYYVGGTAGVRF